MAMETRKRSDGDAVAFMALMFLCCFISNGEQSKLSLGSGRKKNSKIDKWGKGDALVLVEVLREGRLNFCAPTEV